MVYPGTATQASAPRINKYFLIPCPIGSRDLSQQLASAVDGSRSRHWEKVDTQADKPGGKQRCLFIITVQTILRSKNLKGGAVRAPPTAKSSHLLPSPCPNYWQLTTGKGFFGAPHHS